MLSSLRTSRGFASLSALAVVASIAAVGVAGSGMSSSLLEALPGGAWLASSAKGDVVLADGASGTGVARAVVPGAQGSKMSVVHRGGFACVRSETENGEARVNCVDDATFGDAGSARVKSSQQIVRTGDAAYMIEESKGRVRSLDIKTLTPVGEPLTFEAPISTTPDDDGRLLVVELETSTSFVVAATQASEPEQIGTKKGDLFLSLVNGDFAVVAHADAQVTVYSDGVVDRRVSLPKNLPALLVPREVEGSEFAMLARSESKVEVIALHLGTNKGRRVRVSGNVPKANSVYSTSAGLFVPDVGSGKVTRVDTKSGATETIDLGLGKGEGNIEIFVKDDQLWANNPNGSKAVVIDSQGRKREVNKYDPDIKDVDPGWVGDPAPVAAVSRPSPSGPVPPVVAAAPEVPEPNAATTVPVLGDEPAPTPVTTPSAGGVPLPVLPAGGADEIASPDVTKPGAGSRNSKPAGPGAPPKPVERTSDLPKTEEGPRPTPPELEPDAPLLPQAPSRPVSFDGTAADRSIVLSWAAPTGEAAPSRYELTCNPDCGAGHTTVSLKSGTTSRDLTGLRNGRPYAFSLIAVNQAGRSEAAIVANLRPVSTVPSPPTGVNLEAAVDGSVMVSWAAGDGEGFEVIGYDVVLTGDDGSALVLGRIDDLAMRAGVGDGVKTGVAFTAEVRTVSDASPAGAASDAAMSGEPVVAYSVAAEAVLRVVRSSAGPKRFELYGSANWQGRTGTVRLGGLGAGQRSGSGELTFDTIDPAWGTQGQVTVEACVEDDDGQAHCVAGVPATIDARAPILVGQPNYSDLGCMEDPNRPGSGSIGVLYTYDQAVETYGVPVQFFSGFHVDWTYWRGGNGGNAVVANQGQWQSGIDRAGGARVLGGWGQDTDRYFVRSYVSVAELGEIQSAQADTTVADCPQDGPGRGT